MIAVIGSGPVGIFVSHQLLKQGKTVALFDAGTATDESAFLNGESYQFVTPSALPKNVHRLGGGSNYWMHRVSQFIDMDFQEHISRPGTKWPIDLAEIRSHYKDLESQVFTGDLNEQQIKTHLSRLAPSGISHLLSLRPFRYMPEDYFKRLLADMKLNPNFLLKLEHFCLDFHNSEDARVKIKFVTPDGTVTEIADSLIIACGALQSPSLVTRSFLAEGRNFDSIGSPLMEHLEGYVGSIRMKSSQKALMSPFILDTNRRLTHQQFGTGIALEEEILQKNGWPNFQIELVSYIPDYQLNRLLSNYSHQIMNPVLFFLLKKSSYAERFLKKAFYKFIHSISNLFGISYYSVWIKSEEFPSYSSSATYNTHSNQTIYHHSVSDITSKKLREGLLFLSKTFQQENMGSFHFYSRIFDQKKPLYLRPNWHPMGTLPMLEDSRVGIVNPNQELIGFRNVYLCDASIFPSGSNSNPVFTALMLAIRLSKIL